MYVSSGNSVRVLTSGNLKPMTLSLLVREVLPLFPAMLLPEVYLVSVTMWTRLILLGKNLNPLKSKNICLLPKWSQSILKNKTHQHHDQPASTPPSRALRKRPWLRTWAQLGLRCWSRDQTQSPERKTEKTESPARMKTKALQIQRIMLYFPCGDRVCDSPQWKMQNLNSFTQIYTQIYYLLGLL